MPQVRVESDINYDIATHYRDQGWEVVAYEYEPEAVATPYVLNNCVGHVKSVLGIGGWSMVPNGLYQYIMKRSRAPMFSLTVPGFGSQQAAAPTHYSDGTPIGATPVAPKKTTEIPKAEDNTKPKTAVKTTGYGLGDLGGNNEDNENLILLRKKGET